MGEVYLENNIIQLIGQQGWECSDLMEESQTPLTSRMKVKAGSGQKPRTEKSEPKALPFPGPCCPSSCPVCSMFPLSIQQCSLLWAPLSSVFQSSTLTVSNSDSVDPDSWNRDSAWVSIGQVATPGPVSCGQEVGSCLVTTGRKHNWHF